MRLGLLSLGVLDSEIIVLKDADFNTFSQLFRDQNLRIGNNYQDRKKTLVFFYYAGHGILKGFTKAACNRADVPRKVFYPLEQ